MEAAAAEEEDQDLVAGACHQEDQGHRHGIHHLHALAHLQNPRTAEIGRQLSASGSFIFIWLHK